MATELQLPRLLEVVHFLQRRDLVRRIIANRWKALKDRVRDGDFLTREDLEILAAGIADDVVEELGPNVAEAGGSVDALRAWVVEQLTVLHDPNVAREIADLPG